MRDSDLNAATIGKTLRELVSRVNQLATRPFGVNVVRPGEGSLTFYDESGTKTTEITGAWLTVNIRGSNRVAAVMLQQLEDQMASRPPSSWIVDRLNAVDKRRYDGDQALNTALGKRATKSELNSVKSQLLSRIQALESKVNGSSGSGISDATNDGGGVGIAPPGNYTPNPDWT